MHFHKPYLVDQFVVAAAGGGARQISAADAGAFLEIALIDEHGREYACTGSDGALASENGPPSMFYYASEAGL